MFSILHLQQINPEYPNSLFEYRCSKYSLWLMGEGYINIDFQLCEKGCPLYKGMLDFISKGYYPSSPVKPRFAFHVDVLFYFHRQPNRFVTICDYLRTRRN